MDKLLLSKENCKHFFPGIAVTEHTVATHVLQLFCLLQRHLQQVLTLCRLAVLRHVLKSSLKLQPVIAFGLLPAHVSGRRAARGDMHVPVFLGQLE